MYTFVQVKQTATKMDRQIKVSLSEVEQSEILQLVAELCSGGVVSSRDYDHVFCAMESARKYANEVNPELCTA